MKMTRRELAAAVLVTGVAAQTAPQAPPAAPSSPADELQAAHERNRQAAEALAKISLPMESEPAFHFTA
jgi:hypothetical protein